MAVFTQRWCFTLNNPSVDEVGLALALEPYRYLVFQLESGESETPHYQGYVEYEEQRRLRAAKGRLESAHFAPAKGTAEQNLAYCTKAETRVAGPFVDGVPLKQGARNDLVAFRDAIRSGASTAALVEAHPAMVARFPRFVAAVRSSMPRAQRDVRVEFYVGTTGLGKTRACYDRFPELWSKPMGSGLWFDGYDGQSVVLLDDFKGQVSRFELLRLLDRYPLDVPVKGGFVPWLPTLILITSNYEARDWYDSWDKLEETYDALMRRIHKTWRWTVVLGTEAWA